MLGREGRVVSWTVVRVPPTGFSSLAPYPVVIVEFADGKRITAQMVDWSDITFGMKVKVVVRRLSEPPTEGVIPYGIKVRPI